MKLILKKLIKKGYGNTHKFYGALCAEGFDKTYQTVINWVEGKNPPSTNDLPIIAKVLNVSITHLFH